MVFMATETICVFIQYLGWVRKRSEPNAQEMKNPVPRDNGGPGEKGRTMGGDSRWPLF
jgi:hypothetical protein